MDIGSREQDSFEKCTDCGEIWGINDRKCPKCGSPYHTKVMSISDKISISDEVRGKGTKKSGMKRRPFEFIAKDEYQRKLQKRVFRFYRTDREHDRYLEIIIDPETGEVVHHCEESLSEHQGHGNAKKSEDSQK